MSRPAIARRKGQKGFTLIELMVVIAIIGILAAIGAPRLFAYVRTSQTTEVSQFSGRIAQGISSYVDAHDVTTSETNINGAPNLTPGGGTPATELSSVIPELVLPGDLHFAYKVSIITATSGPQNGEEVYCIMATGNAAASTYPAGVPGGIVYISSASSNATGWEGNANRVNYRSGGTAVAGGYCAATGAAAAAYVP